MKKYNIAIVGATGAVGEELLNCVLTFFPWQSIRLLASEKSQGKVITQKGHTFIVETLDQHSFHSIDFAFFSAGGSISKVYAPIAVSSGAIVIDNTSHFRMDTDVPLVVPEVNGDALKKHQGIIANPNCSTIQMVSALKPINDEFHIRRVVVSTYQAVSGAGARAMYELDQQSKAVLNKEKFVPQILPCGADKKQYQIAFNALPQIDLFDMESHFTKEELKMVYETKKIFDQDIEVNATCVRIPVYRGHSESVYIETKEDIDMPKIFALLENSQGVVLQDDIANQIYPQPIQCEGSEKVFVGRLRKDLYKSNAFSMWITSDNLLKGAAYNSIDIANHMIQLKLK